MEVTIYELRQEALRVLSGEPLEMNDRLCVFESGESRVGSG